MHPEVLDENQRDLLSLVSYFSPRFGLVGGTAIALHLGHRRSIDFDLFTTKPFDINQVKKQVNANHKISHTFIQGRDELSILVDRVKLTFYHYPYPIEFPEDFENIIKTPDLLTLGAMKAFALGRRAKWKDYVDLYFLFKEYSFTDLVVKTRELFGQEFNEKFFRIQLSYFEDIDFSEEVIYMPGYEMSLEVIQKKLTDVSVQ